MTEEEAVNSENPKKGWEYWKPKVIYGLVGILIFSVIMYFYNNRGGRFLVYACNLDSAKCYTVQADLDRDTLANPNATLYFSSDRELRIYCEKEFGCSSDEGDSWSIDKIKRL